MFWQGAGIDATGGANGSQGRSGRSCVQRCRKDQLVG
jgi:hypothetical protein